MASWRRIDLGDGRGLVVASRAPRDWSAWGGEGETGVWLLSHRRDDRGRFEAAARRAGVEWLINAADLAGWLGLPPPPGATPSRRSGGRSSSAGGRGRGPARRWTRDPRRRLMALAAWEPPEEARLRVAGYRARIEASGGRWGPDELDRWEAAGAEVRRLVRQVGELARRHGPESAEVDAALERAEAEVEALGGELGEAAAWLLRRRAKRVRRPRPPPPVHVGAAAEHRVDRLRPARRWTLLVDETGDDFSRQGAGRLGRFVGVLVPEGADLPELHGFHATRAGSDRRRALLAELDRHPVGILGITAEAAPEGSRNPWASGVLDLVEWVLRLFSRHAEPPRELRVLVEERGEHGVGEKWKAAATGLVDRRREEGLGEAFPELGIELCAKDDHPHLGWADLVAWAWGVADERGLPVVGRWRHTCLVESAEGPLARAWDAALTGEAIDEEDWNALLREAERRGPDSLAARASELLRSRVAEDPELWDAFAEIVEEGVERQPADGHVLDLQVDWLTEAGDPPSARQALRWNTVRLQRGSHHGLVPFEDSRELRAQARALRDEAPDLACEADLVRANVGANAFLFAKAEKVVEPWCEARPAEPGLRQWGRAWSAMGQLQAFQDRPARARECFETALAAFGRLSDPDEAREDSAQTACYRAIAATDDPRVGDGEAVRLLADYAALVLDGEAPTDLPVILRAVAADPSAPSHPWLHHAAVRFAGVRRKAGEIRDYLDTLPEVPVEAGHPWPLVALWRGLLLLDLDRPGAGRSELERAARTLLAAREAPTVELMGLAVEAVLRRHVAALLSGAERQERLAGFARLSPGLAERARRLAEPRAFRDDRALLAAVLPFNFR